MAKGRKTGGRVAGVPNKATRELKDLARTYTASAIKELARLALKAESEQARVSAIKELFDRGYGKAAQAVEHSGAIGTYDLTNAADDDLVALAALLSRIAESGAGQGGDREA